MQNPRHAFWMIAKAVAGRNRVITTFTALRERFPVYRLVPTEVRDASRLYIASDEQPLEPSAAPTPVAKYAREAFYNALVTHVHEHGLPASQEELVTEMSDRLAESSTEGQLPDRKTIQRRISPVWHAMQLD